MHEILFRGFYPSECGDTTIYVEGEAVKGRWVEGSAVINGKETYIHENSGVTIMSTADKTINPDFVGFYAWKVILSTIGQYTGLNDKNGVKIYTSDIVREYRLEDIPTVHADYIVEFKSQMFVAKNKKSGNVISLCTITVQSELEIIGNTHEKEAKGRI